jgi:transglutaminase-like putative cysteine protease
MPRLLAFLSVLLASVALGRATTDWRLAGLVAGLAAALSAVGPRWDVDRGRRLLTAGMGGGAGYLAAKLLYESHPGTLAEGWTRVACAAILAAAARFLLVGVAGRNVTTALVFLALLAIGETHDPGYGVVVALFVAVSMWAPVVHDEHALLARTRGRRLVAGAAVLLLGAASAASVAFGARRTYEWLSRREHSTALLWSPRVGFSDQIDLGALDGLLDSDTMVLRVRGPRVDYLRGMALDSYVGGRWFRSERSDHDAPSLNIEDAAMKGRTDVVRISTVAARSDRFFVPLEARSIATQPASALVDPLGALKPPGKGLELVVQFVIGDRDSAEPAPPGPADLVVPRAVRAPLTELAEAWTAGAETPEAKLDAIEGHLKSDFRYARTFARVTGPDPVLDFLFGNKAGHCEYFATAMALLARAAGVPARFIGGYRVGEQSPFGYYVVRERNAHAWVEAWLPGRGWVTRDPTPDTELPQNRDHLSGYVAALADGISVAWDNAGEWLQNRTLEETAVAWGIGFAVLVWIVARGVRRRGPPKAPAREEEAALPCFDVLLASLARAGVVHDGHESIERFAARAPDAESAGLLARYAALRYGGLGDLDGLERDMAAYARKGPPTSISPPPYDGE